MYLPYLFIPITIIHTFMCRTKRFCDIRLYPGVNHDGHGVVDVSHFDFENVQPVSAHKIILDHASPYFSQIFRLCDKDDKLEAIIVPKMDNVTLTFLTR